MPTEDNLNNFIADMDKLIKQIESDINRSNVTADTITLLNKLNDKEIMKLNKMNPIYISLSNYFFNNLGNLLAIEYETGDSIAKITRKDLI